MTSLATLTRKAVAAAALLVLFALPVFAQGPSIYPPTWVFARAYNGWSIIGQSTNTFTFNGGVCFYSPYNNGQSAPIFDFSGFQGSTTVYNPVYIQDANSALNEIVTPSATSNTSASCGATLAPANTHTSFVLSSGTAGLQEAITNQLQVTPVFDVILDKRSVDHLLGDRHSQRGHSGHNHFPMDLVLMEWFELRGRVLDRRRPVHQPHCSVGSVFAECDRTERVDHDFGNRWHHHL
jgi:hypothetical protein